jgi:uncharacterized delta-60 repeat protein
MRGLLLFLIVCSCPLLAQPGTLDPTFGTGGISTVGPVGIVYDICIQPDGKILATGDTPDLGLIRYTTDGALDSTFGTNGIVLTTTGANVERLDIVEMTNEGKILVCGVADNDLLLIRYMSDGTLDASFDGDGILIDPTWESNAFTMTQQPDGRILVVGRSQLVNPKIKIQRYAADGTVDASFDGDGYAITDVPGFGETAGTPTVQPDGKILVPGAYGALGGLCMLRYNADGSLDTGFDGDGIWTMYAGGASSEGLGRVVVQPDGKLLACGFSYNGLVEYANMVRLMPDGSMDNTWGVNGLVQTADGYWSELLLQPDGKVVSLGSSIDANLDMDFMVARYLPDGSPDPAFGTGGMTLTAFATSPHGNAGAFDPEGRILMAGGAEPNSTDVFTVLCYYSGLNVGVGENLAQEGSIAVYPNPAQDLVHLEMDHLPTGTWHCEVFDAQGRIAWVGSIARPTTGRHVQLLDLRELLPGYYRVRLSQADASINAGILKQ